MRTITRTLLASVLALGAATLTGCGNTDCSAQVAAGASCSGEGLSCFTGVASCVCNHGTWSCPMDMPDPVRFDMSKPRDLRAAGRLSYASFGVCARRCSSQIGTSTSASTTSCVPSPSTVGYTPSDGSPPCALPIGVSGR